MLKKYSPLIYSNDKELDTIGVQRVPDADLPEKAVEEIGKMLEKVRSLVVIMDNCTKCGACAKQCHSYLGTEDFYNAPVARADLLRKVYKRYFTWSGKVLGKFTGAEDIDHDLISKWMAYYYQCNECRRCAEFCPLGLDTAEITIAMRQVLTNLGLVPKFMQSVGAGMNRTGNNMAIPAPAVDDNVEFFEEEMKDEMGFDIKIPMDEPAEYLYIPSSADFFMNFDTMTGVAKFFHALGVKWTISREIIEAANFGFLFDANHLRSHNERLVRVANKLGAKVVVQGECGHGWRAAKMCTDGISAPVNFRLVHILDFADECLTKGLIKLDSSQNPVRVTLHDPCNYARAGDLIEQPRRLVKASVAEFIEMTPNRNENFCCGGGSAILMDEMMDIRMQLAKKKAEQIDVLKDRIDFVAVPCSICKAQIPHVLSHYGLDDKVQYCGVMDLVGKALVFDK